ESVGGGQILGHDRFSVLGAVAFDVGHGLVDAVDDANGQYGLQIFGEPVVFGGGQRGGQDCPNAFAAAQFDTLRYQGGRNAGQQAGGDVSVHQQGLDRAADAVAIGLGVDHDVVGLGRVGGLVEVDMAIAVEMLDERYPSRARKSFDQALAATRNDDVDVLGERDHFTHSGAVGGVDDLYGIGRQPCGSEPFLDDRAQRLVRVKGFAAATQNGGIARFEAKCGGVNRDVGA